MDQAQKLRAKVNQNKLSNLIDDIKNVKDITEIYKNLIDQNQSNSKVICFISAKGGVGKSLLIYSFADILKKSGKKTAIIDMNKHYSDVSSYFPECDLIKVNKSNLLENSCFNVCSSVDTKQCVFQISNEIRGVEYQLIKIVMYQARLSNFDFVLIDTAICVSEFLENISDIADEIWCVINNDFNAVSNTLSLLFQFNSVLQKEYPISFAFNEFTGINSKSVMNNFFNELQKMENLKISQNIKIEFDKKLKENSDQPINIKETGFYKTIQTYISNHLLEDKNYMPKTALNKILDKFKFGF
ncbi:AAA family ATPase [Candidatus Dependentiae bacterium]|nr:AAA family ATPase [Candidatus Dependentiae bacterium]